jgi:hypothetical protein
LTTVRAVVVRTKVEVVGLEAKTLRSKGLKSHVLDMSSCRGHLNPPARHESIASALSKWHCIGVDSSFAKAWLKIPMGLPVALGVRVGGWEAWPGGADTLNLRVT